MESEEQGCEGECQNGGECRNGECVCLAGYAGDLCEVDPQGGSGWFTYFVLLCLIGLGAAIFYAFGANLKAQA